MTRAATSTEVYRIAWLPGTDVLSGTCHCGAEHESEDPAEMWDWMLGHPDGHRPPAATGKERDDRRHP